jgi:catechol-2,3-dioxygenase
VPVEGFAELTLEVHDLQALERFYTEAFGLSVLQRRDDRIWLSAGPSARLGLWTTGKKEMGDQGGRHVHFAFSATPGGLEELADRLRNSGTDVEGPVEHDGGDRSIYCEDPEGNVVEVWDFFGRDRDLTDLADDVPQ